MTVQSRGPRSRRGGRGPGWMLLTALLVLAILASSTLVFTNRVELLRLAVVLSLWAAVMAAFVTVIYRRQSDIAQARARDMKFVYDLQLDREISARREYELSVEARLRRQLSREGLQAADEMAALRSELVSLRSQLEVMLGTDLAPRPALERDRIAVPMPPAPGRVESSRVTVVAEEIVTVVEEADYAVESPIIDVSEEPVNEEPVNEEPVNEEPVNEEPVVTPVVTPPPTTPEPPVRSPHRRPEPEHVIPAAVAVPPPPPEAPWRPPEVRFGRHANGDGPQYAPRPEPAHALSPPPPVPPRGRHWVPPQAPANPAGRHRPSEPVAEEPAVVEPAQEPAELEGQHADGQSFADLMQRLQVDRPARGGGRRRRED
jgi:hypothetical protein